MKRTLITLGMVISLLLCGQAFANGYGHNDGHGCGGGGGTPCTPASDPITFSLDNLDVTNTSNYLTITKFTPISDFTLYCSTGNCEDNSADQTDEILLFSIGRSSAADPSEEYSGTLNVLFNFSTPTFDPNPLGNGDFEINFRANKADKIDLSFHDLFPITGYFGSGGELGIDLVFKKDDEYSHSIEGFKLGTLDVYGVFNLIECPTTEVIPEPAPGVVPEPGSLLLLGSGMILVAGLLRRKK